MTTDDFFQVAGPTGMIFRTACKFRPGWRPVACSPVPMSQRRRGGAATCGLLCRSERKFERSAEALDVAYGSSAERLAVVSTSRQLFTRERSYLQRCGTSVQCRSGQRAGVSRWCTSRRLRSAAAADDQLRSDLVFEPLFPRPPFIRVAFGF
jgi:hypothetical protein